MAREGHFRAFHDKSVDCMAFQVVQGVRGTQYRSRDKVRRRAE